MIEIERNGVKHELDVDVLEELSPFDWERSRVVNSEMQAISPFRDDDRSPSFSINIETGLWIDFGSEDYYSRGNLITLLSFLRNETPSEIEDYLLKKYGIDLSDVDKLELHVKLELNTNTNTNTIISTNEYMQYGFRSPYLAGRGITEKVQKAFRIGYDKKGKAVAIPWMDIHGNIINVKFRSVHTKRFYYYPTGQPIRNHLYGMHFIYKLKYETAYIVESEIDALYLWSHGYPAIALGGSNISDSQRQLILRSPIKNLVLATDNDRVGKQIREKLITALAGYIELSELNFPEGAKDVNDLSPEQLKSISNNATPVIYSMFKSLTK